MEDQVESTTNNFGEYGVVRGAECGFLRVIFSIGCDS